MLPLRSNSRTKLTRDRNVSRVRHLIGFTALIMLVFSSIVIYQSAKEYNQALEQGKRDAERLVATLSEHIELSFLGIDLALRRAIERQQMNSLFGNNLTTYMEQNFRLWLKETPQIIAMAIIDSSGDINVATHKKEFAGWLNYAGGFADQELFKKMEQSSDKYVYIGMLQTPLKNQLIILGRRYDKTDGTFGGIVLAAMDPNYFVRFYQSIAPGKHKFMSLTLEDGTILSSGPSKAGHNDTIIYNLSQKKAEEPLLNEPSQAYTVYASEADRIQTVAHRTLNNLPATAHVVLDETDILASWRHSRAKDLGLLVLFVVFGSVLAFLAIAMARQITRAEESEESAILASQAKSEFLANMSHELRTPLNAIIGFSEMMNSGYFGPLTPKQKERIHDINLCGTHLLQLISDILEFSKGDAGKLELVEEIVDVTHIVHECERIMSGKLKAKGIDFSISMPETFPNLWADKRKLRQILLNLLTNSIKFTPRDGIIEILCELDPQNQINISVCDSGIGISEQDIAKALSVFGQVHQNQNYEGTGLGLPLCKMYAELHGGKLLLTSKLGKGTHVRVIFPSKRTLKNKKKQEALPEKSS